MTQDFHNDLTEMMEMVSRQQSFAFSRYNDGECRILQNDNVGNKDGWFYHAHKDLAFRSDLRRALLVNHPNYFYGLSSEQCDPINHRYALDRINCAQNQITFGNLFTLSNAKRFHEEFIPAIRSTKLPVFLIANDKIRQAPTQSLLGRFEFIPLKGCCVKLWNEKSDWFGGRLDLAASQYPKAIFLFCAGPLTKILIHEAWLQFPKHLYLDIGSAIDLTLFSKSWRADHREPEKYDHLTPQWSLKTS